jgi:WD40 repeat protein
MTPERLEELLRTRPSDQRTYNRELPDLAMRRESVRASGLPLGWAAAVLVVGLVAVVGATSFGPWQRGPSAANPSASATASRQAFSATGSMKEARQQASATLLKDGRVLVVGGNDVNNPAPVPSAELYDPATGKFTLTGTPHVAVEGGVPVLSVLLNSGRVLVIGCDPSSSPSGSCASSLADVYDPSTGLFGPVGPITGGCMFCTATLLNDGRVLVARGAGPEPSLLFDPATDTFETTGSMTTFRVSQTPTLLSDGRVLIAGGFDNTLVSLASAELYDPRTGTFSPTGSMTTARAGQTATLLSDGRVLIAGGGDNTGDRGSAKSLASAELYDPNSGTFSPTGSMTTARIGQTATQLSDGRVLIAGGRDITLIAYAIVSPGAILAGNIPASAELYDPRTGTFSPTGSMTSARVGHTATLLSDGRVLIAGGYDSLGNSVVNPLSSAELYQP